MSYLIFKFVSTQQISTGKKRVFEISNPLEGSSRRVIVLLFAKSIINLFNLLNFIKKSM